MTSTNSIWRPKVTLCDSSLLKELFPWFIAESCLQRINRLHEVVMDTVEDDNAMVALCPIGAQRHLHLLHDQVVRNTNLRPPADTMLKREGQEVPRGMVKCVSLRASQQRLHSTPSRRNGCPLRWGSAWREGEEAEKQPHAQHMHGTWYGHVSLCVP